MNIFGGGINVKFDLSNYATKTDLKNISHVDASSFALKSNLASLKTEVDKLDIADTSDLAKRTGLNAKITKIENKIPSIAGLVTNSALTAVENKIPDVSSLVKKTDYNTEISEIENKVNDHNHGKYITTPEFNTLTARVFNARLAQANLIPKTDFDVKLNQISDRIT